MANSNQGRGNMDENRIQKIKDSIPGKMFFDPCFEKSDRNNLIKDIEFSFDKKINDSNILNCHALLKKEQEYHLFRKLNYFKYRLLKLTVGFEKSSEQPAPKPSKPVKLNRLGEKSLSEIESLILKIQDTRNIIIKANMRLIVRQVNKYASEDSFHREEFFSHAYFHMFKAIDCFDYRRNFKFSTYFINVLNTNLRRDYFYYKKYDDLLYLPENPISQKNYQEEILSERNHEYNKCFLKKAFESMRGRFKNSDINIIVLKKYFGIDCERLNLKEIGEELNLSKERIRQIKLASLNYLSSRVETYDPLV